MISKGSHKWQIVDTGEILYTDFQPPKGQKRMKLALQDESGESQELEVLVEYLGEE